MGFEFGRFFDGILGVALVAVVPTLAAMTLGYVVIFLHECAHAVCAAVLGVRVQAIQLGGGPFVEGVRVGRTQVHVHAYPTHGHVALRHRPGRALRARWILVCLAGPLCETVCTVAFILGGLASWDSIATLLGGSQDPYTGRREHLSAIAVGLPYAFWVVAALLSMSAVNSWIPWSNPLDGFARGRSDMLQVMDLLRASRAEMRDLQPALARSDRMAHAWELHLRGEHRSARERGMTAIDHSEDLYGALMLEISIDAELESTEGAALRVERLLASLQRMGESPDTTAGLVARNFLWAVRGSMLGFASWARIDDEDALRAMRPRVKEARKRNPTDWAAATCAALIEARVGRPVVTRSLARASLRLAPDLDGAALSAAVLALAETRAGRDARARRWFARAERWSPGQYRIQRLRELADADRAALSGPAA